MACDEARFSGADSIAGMVFKVPRPARQNLSFLWPCVIRKTFRTYQYSRIHHLKSTSKNAKTKPIVQGLDLTLQGPVMKIPWLCGIHRK